MHYNKYYGVISETGLHASIQNFLEVSMIGKNLQLQKVVHQCKGPPTGYTAHAAYERKAQALGATKVKLAGAIADNKALRKKLHQQEAHCRTNCITLPYLPDKPYDKLKEQSSCDRRLKHYLVCLKELQSKMKMSLTPEEEVVAEKYWKAVYKPIIRQDDDSDMREPELDPNEEAWKE